jgi:hypothetical protein
MIEEFDFEKLETLWNNLTPHQRAHFTPHSRAELWEYIAEEYGVEIPRTSVCAGHCSPFDALADGFFSQGGDYVWVGPRTGGKGSPLSTPVATPTGWRAIGDLALGDEVFGADGRPARVLGIYDRGMLPVYRVRFSDGASLVVDGDHKWAVQTRKLRKTSSPYRLLTTIEIMQRGFDERDHALIIPMVEPVQYPHADLPIDPYALGMLLANGYLDMSTFVALHQDDSDILDRFGVTNVVHARRHGAGIRFGVPGIAATLRNLGLYGSRSGTKFIPRMYFLASVQQRLDLLHGLMDGDGTAHDANARYSTTSERLGVDLQELVESLGGTAKISSRNRGEYTEHRVTVNLPPSLRPFWSKRKSVPYEERYAKATVGRPTRRIAAIEPCGEELVRCIGVDNESHLYVSDRFIVSHNTLQAAILEHMIMTHFGDTVAHAGAIEVQALKCYEYLRSFFGKPQFRDDVLGDSLMSSTILRNGAKVEVLPMTMNRLNSPHTRFLFLDEIELTTNALLNEARSIPMRVNGRAPLTIYTSSRKFAVGPMEDMLRTSKDAGRRTYFWCVFEIMKNCPPERHQDGSPSGCGSCKLEPICREKTTDLQGTQTYVPGPGKASRSAGWMNIDDVIGKYTTIESGTFESQWLSKKPDTKGLAYPMFDENVHVIDYDYNPAFPVVQGIDFGYTNPTAVISIQPLANDDIVIFDEVYRTNTLADELADIIKRQPWFGSTSFRVADSADPGSRNSLIKRGVSNEPANKAATAEDKSSVIAGIKLLRWLLAPQGRKRPILYVSRRCVNTIREFQTYHHPDPKEDRNVDERPVQSSDHAMDAARYVLTRVYRGHVSA